jgi:hypothetical protein
MQKPKNLKELKKDTKFLKDQKETAVPKRISDLRTSVKNTLKDDEKSTIKKFKNGGKKGGKRTTKKK